MSQARLHPLLAAAVLLASTAAAATPPYVNLNQAQPRPFYLFAHNPNTVQQALDAVVVAANALEPDVNSYDDCPNASASTPLVVAHDVSCGDLDKNGQPPAGAVLLTDYLDGVNWIARNHSTLALVVFDIKSPAAKPWRGPEIAHAVHHHLNANGVELNVIYSVASRKDGGVFDNIISCLGLREGVMVDEEDDVATVSNYFIGRGLYENFAYGDGTSQLGPKLPRAIDHGAFYRASRGFPSAVTYVYTLQDAASMHWFINAGVDGIIPDTYGLFGMPHPQNLGTLKTLLDVTLQHPEIRRATRADNPFQPALEAYGLEIQTANVQDAGTDALLYITLTGCNGSAIITYDTGMVKAGYASLRMTQGQKDWVTIPSKDLGQLSSITVQNVGNGAAPGWQFTDIRVSSARYLGPDENNVREYKAVPQGVLLGGHTVTLDLIPNFAEPAATILCPADVKRPNDWDQCGAFQAYKPAVTSSCQDAVAISSPPSGSFFPVGTTAVSSYAQSDTSPDSAACGFTVTVVDAQAPIVRCPPPLEIDAVGPNGAYLTWNNSAGDNCPGVSPVTCDAAQGSLFPISTTPIHCSASDAAGNPGSCAFSVRVRGAAEQLQRLIAKIDSSSNPTRVKLSLELDLQNLLGLMADTSAPHTQAELCAALDAFIAKLTSNPGAIPQLELDDLIAAAQRIFSVMGCATGGAAPPGL